MNGQIGCDGQLVNETGINVVALLKGEIGERRCYRVEIDTFPLAEDLVARDVRGEARLTRLRDRILVDGEFRADAELECVRCLTRYRQLVDAEFTEQYWQTVDVRTGVWVEPLDLTNEERDEDRFEIDEHHELDLGEALRQHLVLALPMRPDCGEACQGPNALLPADEQATEERENPFAALAALLDDE